MQYLVLMHSNTVSFPSDEDWDKFFDAASKTGLFRGGSAVAGSKLLGNVETLPIGESVAGFMRFDADNYDELAALLQKHPTVMHGGTIEIYEMPIEG